MNAQVVNACMHVCVDGGGRGEGECVQSLCVNVQENLVNKKQVTAQTYNFTYLSFSSVSTPVSDDVLVCVCVHVYNKFSEHTFYMYNGYVYVSACDNYPYCPLCQRGDIHCKPRVCVRVHVRIQQ